MHPPGVILLFATSCLAASAREPEAASPAPVDADTIPLVQRTFGRAGSRRLPAAARRALAEGVAQTPAEAGLGLLQARGRRVLRIPSTTVDLDLPPEQRWVAFYAAHREKLLMPEPDVVAEMPQPVFVAPKELRSQVDFAADGELLAELRGIVAGVNDSRVTLETLLNDELGYEGGFTSGCTALLAATANGTVFHGRNLDIMYGMYAFDYIFDATFYRGGKPLFATTHFFGSVGTATGYRIGRYSIAQNTRPGVEQMARNAAAAKAGGRPMEFLIRETLQYVDNFRDAVSKLAEVPVIAPQYFTLAGAGPWEGALITRDRKGSPAPHANVEVLSPQIDRWFIAQTNDDTWRPALDDRRPTLLHKLSEMTAEMVNPSSMLDLMMTEPVLNNGTAFTWILEPSTGHRRVFLGIDELNGIRLPSLAVP